MTQALEIVMTDGECLMDSRVLAARLGYKHETVVRNITRHQAKLEAKSALRQVVGVLKHQSYRGSTRQIYYLLDERQCLILAGSLKKGVEADEWHDRLVDEFLQARLRVKQLEAGKPAQQHPIFALSEALRLRAMDNLQRVPAGSFCVQAELFKHLYNLERLLDASLDGQAQIEESVGHLWSRHVREVLHLPESARRKYAHVCQDGRVVQAWAYPMQYVNVFMVWLWEDYFPHHLPAYQQYRARRLALPAAPRKGIRSPR